MVLEGYTSGAVMEAIELWTGVRHDGRCNFISQMFGCRRAFFLVPSSILVIGAKDPNLVNRVDVRDFVGQPIRTGGFQERLLEVFSHCVRIILLFHGGTIEGFGMSKSPVSTWDLVRRSTHMKYPLGTKKSPRRVTGLRLALRRAPHED